MEIIKPCESELDMILELAPKAFYESTMGEVFPTAEKVNAMIKKLKEDGAEYFIAKDKNQLMGWILIGSKKEIFTDLNVGFIYELFVLEEFRQKGISKLLLEKAIQYFNNKGYSEIKLNVYSGNQAAQIYKQIGFYERNIGMSMSLKSTEDQ